MVVRAKFRLFRFLNGFIFSEENTAILKSIMFHLIPHIKSAYQLEVMIVSI